VSTRSKSRVNSIARLFGNALVFPSGENGVVRKGLSRRTFRIQAEAIGHARRVGKCLGTRVLLREKNGERYSVLEEKR
jgi:hypothetical protein